MATFLTNPLPASDAKIRFMEPYVSNGLNRRTVGVIPTGVYRGYDVSAVGTTVTISADLATMDSVAVCETLDEALVANQFQLTVRHEGDIVLDFSGLAPADYPNAIVLETIYDITGTSPLTGVTTVAIKVIELADVKPEHVVLAHTTLVGPNVIVDDSFREDNGGEVLTPASLASTVDVYKVDTMFVNPAAGFTGAFTNIAGAVLNFNTTETGIVMATGNAIITTAFDGAGELRFMLDGVTAGTTTLRVGGSAAVDDGSGQLLANAGGTWTDVFSGVAPGAHTLQVQGGGSTFAAVYNVRITAQHK
jgi:hypothetical protein